MSEGDVQRMLDMLTPILKDEAEIDEFEKLYVITSAKLNSPRMFDEDAYDSSEFDEICNFAQYKLNNPAFFDGDRKQATQRDTSFYIIPIHIEMAGSKLKCEALVDANGNSLYIIFPDGRVIPSLEFQKVTGISDLLKVDALTSNDASELLKTGQGINEIAKLIETGKLDIDSIREDSFLIVSSKGKGLDPEAIIKAARERDLPKDRQEYEEQIEEEEEENTLEDSFAQQIEEEEVLEEKAKEEAESRGVSFDILQSIAKQKGCKVHQISYRELDDPTIIQDRIGKNLNNFRRTLGVARITYGFREEVVIFDKTNGQIQIDNRRFDHELVELVPRWPHVTIMPITRRRDEKNLGMSYIDKFGNVNETSFVYNGKQIDMVKEERERYLAEVYLADKALSDAIEEYQKVDPSKQPDLAREKWKVVSKSMAKRISIDNKYDVLKNQRQVTARTLEATIKQTVKEVGMPRYLSDKEREIKKIEEEDPRLSHHWDPRWDF